MSYQIKKDLLERAAENAFQNKDVHLASAFYDQIEKTAAARVDTSDYENSNGKKPRGSGHWAFSLGTNPRKAGFDSSKDYVFFADGTYGVALKQAKEEAKKRDVMAIYVLA